MGEAELWALLALLPVMVGALLQRVTGLGFALVASPFLVLLFGPEVGVLVVNACGMVATVTGSIIDRRHIEPRRLAALVPAGVVGALLGVLIASFFTRALLEIVVGILLALGLLASIAVRPSRLLPSTPLVGASAGLVAGLGSGLAGLPGPPMAIYAKLSGWRGRGVAASFQVLFLAISTTATVTRLMSGTAFPDTGGWFVAALVIALGLGLITGHYAAAVIPNRIAWAAVVLISLLGSAATIIHGFVTLVG